MLSPLHLHCGCTLQTASTNRNSCAAQMPKITTVALVSSNGCCPCLEHAVSSGKRQTTSCNEETEYTAVNDAQRTRHEAGENREIVRNDVNLSSAPRGPEETPSVVCETLGPNWSNVSAVVTPSGTLPSGLWERGGAFCAYVLATATFYSYCGFGTNYDDGCHRLRCSSVHRGRGGTVQRGGQSLN